VRVWPEAWHRLQALTLDHPPTPFSVSLCHGTSQLQKPSRCLAKGVYAASKQTDLAVDSTAGCWGRRDEPQWRQGRFTSTIIRVRMVTAPATILHATRLSINRAKVKAQSWRIVRFAQLYKWCPRKTPRPVTQWISFGNSDNLLDVDRAVNPYYYAAKSCNVGQTVRAYDERQSSRHGHVICCSGW